ncbi:hypothetical protein ACFLW1_03045 [Chloroflexota bacterium]
MYDDAALMRKYQETLSEAVWNTQGRQPNIGEDNEPADSGWPYRGSELNPELSKVEIE